MGKGTVWSVSGQAAAVLCMCCACMASMPRRAVANPEVHTRIWAVVCGVDHFELPGEGDPVHQLLEPSGKEAGGQGACEYAGRVWWACPMQAVHSSHHPPAHALNVLESLEVQAQHRRQLREAHALLRMGQVPGGGWANR